MANVLTPVTNLKPSHLRGLAELSDSSDPPGISVIVPVYNGGKTISRTVECLLRQSLLPLEIIIVDDGSTDDTAEKLKPFENQILYSYKPNGGPASARNHGVRLASGDFVAFTDSDCLPDRDWLLRLVGGFDSAQVAGVGGAVRNVGDSLTGEFVDVERLLDPAKNRQGAIEYLITANACFRRDLLIEAGLFDERFRKPGGEEPSLCRRIRELGYEFRYVKDAVVLHHHRQTIRSFLKTISNYGEGLYLLAQIWPDYRVSNPAKKFFRSVIAVRALAWQLPEGVRRHGVKKALAFSAIEYLRRLAFLWGYLRGQRHGN